MILNFETILALYHVLASHFAVRIQRESATNIQSSTPTFINATDVLLQPTRIQNLILINIIIIDYNNSTKNL